MSASATQGGHSDNEGAVQMCDDRLILHHCVMADVVACL